MKIYLIHIDALPNNYLIEEFAQKKNLNFSYTINGGINTEWTIMQYMTGLLDSNTIPNGIGYNMRTDMVNEPYNFKKHNIKRINNSLINILLDKKWDVTFRNESPPKKYIVNKDYINSDGSYSHPNLNSIYSNIKNPQCYKQKYFVDYHNKKWNHPRVKDFYDEEKKYNNYIQTLKDRDQLFWIFNFDYHEFSAHYRYNNYMQNKKYEELFIKRILDYLDSFDFDEPDSFFWIYSDHGIDTKRDLNPHGYLTWALIKDNTIKSNNTIKPILRGCDFFKTIIDKINYNDNKILNDCLHFYDNIYNKLDKNRYYFVSDSRLIINPYNNDTNAIIKIIEWNDDTPKLLVQLTHIRGDFDQENKFIIKNFDIDNKITKTLFSGSELSLLDFINNNKQIIYELLIGIKEKINIFSTKYFLNKKILDLQKKYKYIPISSDKVNVNNHSNLYYYKKKMDQNYKNLLLDYDYEMCNILTSKHTVQNLNIGEEFNIYLHLCGNEEYTPDKLIYIYKNKDEVNYLVLEKTLVTFNKFNIFDYEHYLTCYVYSKPKYDTQLKFNVFHNKDNLYYITQNNNYKDYDYNFSFYSA